MAVSQHELYDVRWQRGKLALSLPFRDFWQYMCERTAREQLFRQNAQHWLKQTAEVNN